MAHIGAYTPTLRTQRACTHESHQAAFRGRWATYKNSAGRSVGHSKQRQELLSRLPCDVPPAPQHSHTGSSARNTSEMQAIQRPDKGLTAKPGTHGHTAGWGGGHRARRGCAKHGKGPATHPEMVMAASLRCRMYSRSRTRLVWRRPRYPRHTFWIFLAALRWNRSHLKTRLQGGGWSEGGGAGGRRKFTTERDALVPVRGSAHVATPAAVKHPCATDPASQPPTHPPTHIAHPPAPT
jgi:hypothetical protein